MKMLQDLLITQPGVAAMDQLARERHFETLMDNGIAAAESLQLSIGVSLSADQVNALQADMIWLEEKQVAGQKVLVPVVYLSGSSVLSGAVLAGGNVDLRGGEVSNHGVIRADTNLELEATAGNVTNTGQLQSGDILKITAKKDIVNLSGEVSGHNVTLDAGGNVIHRTTSEVLGDDRYRMTAIGRQAVIDATGSLTVNSGGNIHITAANMSGESVSLNSGEDIIVDSIGVLLEYDTSQGSHKSTGREVSHLTSSITSTLNLLMEAEKNIVLMGADVVAGGNATLLAGDNIRIEAVEDEYSHYHQDKSSGSFGRSSTTSTEIKGKELVGSSIVSGGVLTLEAEKGSISLLASTGHGEQGVKVDAGGDVIVESGVNSSTYQRIVEDKNAARVKTTDSGYHKESLAVAGLSSGVDLSINAKGNVEINGASLVAGDTLRIGKATIARDEFGAMILGDDDKPVVLRGDIGNITLGTVSLTNETWDETTRSLRGPVAELAKVATTALGVGAFILPELALVKGPDITLSSGSGKDRSRTEQVGSQLEGSNVLLVAQDTVTLTGANIAADSDTGRVMILADVILGDTAVTETVVTDTEQKKTASGIGPSLSKDEATLGGLKVTDSKNTTVTRTVNHTGTSISGNQILLQADSLIGLINADITATGENSSLVLDSSTILVTGIQDTHEVGHIEETREATLSMGIRNAYVDASYAVKAVKDAGAAVDSARRALSEAQRAYDRGEISAGALDDHKAMLGMATANFAQAELAATQALAAGAAGTAAVGTGFYVSGNAQVTETRSEEKNRIGVWQGSTLSADNMSIRADVASIIGSEVNAGVLMLDAGSILLGAGTNTQSSSFEQDSKTVGGGVSSSGAGSWNANVGYNTSSNSSEATQHVYTQLNVGHLSSTSDTLTLKGAVITANTADIITGTLTVESLQDTHNSNNSSRGANVGVGGGSSSTGVPQSGSGGVSFASGNSEGAITTEQSAILIANGADSQITAKHTNIIGGLIANATRDEDGNLTDHGELNFTTNTLRESDLRDYSKSSQTGGGVQTGFGMAQYSGDSKEHYVGTGEDKRGKDYLSGSTTLSLQSEGHRMEGETRATIGGGNIIVGGVSLDDHQDFQHLNRDVEKTQVVTLDQQTGAMNSSVTVDHRWTSSTGRQVIIDDHVNLKDNAKITAAGLASDVARVGAVAASVGEIAQLGNSLKRIDGSQEVVYRDEGELAAHVKAFREGNIEDAVAAQELLNTLDGALNDGDGSRVRVTDGAFNPDGNLVAGAANRETNTVYADMGEDARVSIINTMAHEGMHLSGAGEWMAGVTGYLADFTYRVNAWANDSAIGRHGPIYIPVHDLGKHNQLLENNWKQYGYDASTNSLLYRQLTPAEVSFIDRKAVAFASEYYGISDREISVDRLEAAKHTLQDAALWLVDDHRRRQGYGPDERAMDYLTESDVFGSPAQDDQWMFLANREQRGNYWMNMSPDDPRSMAIYDAIISAGPYSIGDTGPFSRDDDYIIGGQLRPWGSGDHMLPLSEAIDGKIYTGSRYPCYVAACIGNNYSNDPSTQALLKAKDDKARQDYLMVAGALTGGAGIGFGLVRTKIPAGLAHTDNIVLFTSVLNDWYAGDFSNALGVAISIGAGKTSGRLAQEAEIHSAIPPLIDFYTSHTLKGLEDEIRK